jgi:hypothetical protein
MQVGVKKVHVHVYLPGCLWHHLLYFAFLGKVYAISEGSGSNVNLTNFATLPKLCRGTPPNAASQQSVDASFRLRGVILDSTSVLQQSVFNRGMPPSGTASLQSVPGASCTFDGGMPPGTSLHRHTHTPSASSMSQPGMPNASVLLPTLPKGIDLGYGEYKNACKSNCSVFAVYPQVYHKPQLLSDCPAHVHVCFKPL